MDDRLIAWGRRPARPVPGPPGRRQHVPRLWLFTDAKRLPHPVAAASRLPPGRCGIVFRFDPARDYTALARQLERICRARRLALVVAGDARLAAKLKAGVHLRKGRRSSPIQCHGLMTSSAHSLVELRRAAKAGADLAFLSPAFPTDSHPGAPGLGALRWRLIGRRMTPDRMRIGALGGVSGESIRRLGPACQAAGAITALAG